MEVQNDRLQGRCAVYSLATVFRVFVTALAFQITATYRFMLAVEDDVWATCVSLQLVSLHLQGRGNCPAHQKKNIALRAHCSSSFRAGCLGHRNTMYTMSLEGSSCISLVFLLKHTDCEVEMCSYGNDMLLPGNKPVQKLLCFNHEAQWHKTRKWWLKAHFAFSQVPGKLLWLAQQLQSAQPLAKVPTITAKRNLKLGGGKCPL